MSSRPGSSPAAAARRDIEVELARWRAVLDCARDAIISIDSSGCVTLFNRSAEEIFGYAAREVLGRNVGMLMRSPHGKQHDDYLEAYRQTGIAKAIGRIRYVEARRKGGEVFPIELSVSEARVGDEILYTAILRDVSERKEIEEARARLAAIVESTNVAIVGTDLDGRITSWNLGAARLYGYGADEVLGHDVSLLVPEDRHAELADELGRVRRGDRVTQRQAVRLRKDGGTIEVLLDASPIHGREGEIVGISSIASDLSELKHAERRLAAQYAITRVLASATSLAEASHAILSTIAELAEWEVGELWHADLDSGLLLLSGAWRAPTVAGDGFERLTRGATFARGEGLPGRVWASGEPLWIDDLSSAPEFMRVAEAARLGMRSFFAFPIPGAGRTTAVVAFLARRPRPPDRLVLDLLWSLRRQIGDFIERKRAEELVRENEARFHAFMSHNPSVAYVKDGAGRYVYVNATFERTFRLPFESIRGKTDAEIWPADVADRVRANDLVVMAENRALELSEGIPVPEGGDREWLVSKFPIEESSGRRLLGTTAIDVTERRRAEQRLRELERSAQRRERLADIGAITAKIAHDLGNPLTGISLQARLILNRARREPNQPLSSIVESAEQFQSEIARLEGLLRGLLGFARDQRLDLRATDLREVLGEVYRLWQPVATARNIDLSLDLAPDVPRPRVDSGQLRRVFDNLVKNAFEAIDRERGAVRIVLSPPSGGRVRVSVADTGPGIADGVELFSLFETTKPEGSGLGLALSRQIVLAHGGDIQCERLSPHGTAFHVDLPLGDS
jgi:PAS domain S-box-containing protein